ncbi:hypothetical protein N7520_005325 [Penicillium odoratum]|uniref:uncharacterized protein n=1 Tax=Penicillium odoratum TaxID=1167516 RepID=UPI0025475773|nr:uncharacterized protein N7520_005325 [Penicillium odoratum]KAJ5765766.1 hypothetical protein N7520_005325 [Penicillium odoratum]
MEMLDEEHEPLPQPSGDTNIYNLGSINNHNVVIAGLPKTGNCSAATVVTQMRMTFPALKYGLLVGIGGGVPVKTDHGMIRLGHVVVSEPTSIHSGAVQYDHGKARLGRFERKGSLPPPPTALLNVVREVAVRRQRMNHDPIWQNVQRIQTHRRHLRRFKYPGPENDHLYKSDYLHQQQGALCETICDPKQRIENPVDAEDDAYVVVHRGTIASGELVIKDATIRDELAQEHGVLCFEMEAAGVLTDFPCMIIRGISDYCDSHKNDRWHGYAAAVAAAYARQLFIHMAIEDTPRENYNFALPLNLSGVFAVNEFIARKDELGKLQKILEGDGRRTAIFNAKDELCLKQSFLKAAEWILRHHPSIAYIADALESQDLDQVVEAVKRWLDEPMNHHWLCVYDNYDNPLLGEKKETVHVSCGATGSHSESTEDVMTAFDLLPYFPQTDHGAIVVTTRSSAIKFGAILPLGKLQDMNDSLDILASTSYRASFKDDPAANELAKKLDGLPLALATAGSYLDQVSMSCTDYLKLYDESWLQLHEDTPQLPAYDKKLYSTWNVSYSYIEQQSPLAAKLLRQWAYFSNEDLWYELLRESIIQKPKWLEELTSSTLTFHGVLRLLSSHGLVEALPPSSLQLESRGYSVHGCVHSWMIHVLNQKPDEEMIFTAFQSVTSRTPEQDQPEIWSIERRLMPHADRCWEIMTGLEVGHNALAFLNNLACLYSSQYRFPEAIMILDRALQGFEGVLGPDHLRSIDTVHHLVSIYIDQRRFTDAEMLCERVLKGYEKLFGPNHLSTFDAISNLGVIYTEQRRFTEAKAMLERALEGKERICGPEHSSTLCAALDLSTLYMNQRQFTEAEALCELVIKGYKKIWGRGYKKTFNAIYHLGVIYMKQCRFPEAQLILQPALQDYEKECGPDHKPAFSAFRALGLLCLSQGQFSEAEALCEQGLKYQRRIWGPDHMMTLGTIGDLGINHMYQNRYTEAKLMLERALQGYEKDASTYIKVNSHKQRNMLDER